MWEAEKYVDEQSKREIKETLVQFDRSLLVMDPRRYAGGPPLFVTLFTYQHDLDEHTVGCM